MGRYLNDWIMNFTVKRNHGVFEAEFRLWYVKLAAFHYIVISAKPDLGRVTLALSCM